MHKKVTDYIQLKQRRDIGDAITAFFDFFKKNLKPFVNIFIGYNGLFILGYLGVSYLMVTGFVGSIRSSPGIDGTVNNGSHELMLGLGLVGFILLFIVTAILNYSLAAAYMVAYEQNNSPMVTKAQVWELIYKNLGKIIIFILLLILIYVGVLIVGIIISFVPVLGTFAYYALMMGFTSWMGLSFMAMIHKDMDVTEGFGEGWKLMVKYFWKCVLVNLVVGILLMLLFLLVLTIPGILIGVYAFHAVETGVDLENSAVATVVWTIALTILLVVSCFNQSISQFSNGVLYYSLYEETYNEYTRNMIDQIGASEEI
jgi:hypothetical protein